MAEPDFDIDQLKADWQKQDVQSKYGAGDIEQMLNHKSRNYVKYIYWISLLEFLVILLANAYYYFVNDSSDSVSHILEKMNISNSKEIITKYDNLYLIMKVLSFVITGVFVVLFYINFKKIKVESNLKKFILQIIRFKKTVNAFILVNIGLIVGFILIFGVYFMKLQSHTTLKSSTFTGLIVGFILAAAIGVGLLWLYYKLVYGIILNRLSYNLEQLKEIEANQ